MIRGHTVVTELLAAQVVGLTITMGSEFILKYLCIKITYNNIFLCLNQRCYCGLDINLECKKQ